MATLDLESILIECYFKIYKLYNDIGLQYFIKGFDFSIFRTRINLKILAYEVHSL